MLFDEKELNIFDSNDARQYFQEILQSYYGKNYRATVVLLYSFTVYDLFSKLQTMSNEGDKTAKKAVNDIRQMIADDEKYSTVENTIINFFKDNCKLYFRRFIEDIEYLKNVEINVHTLMSMERVYLSQVITKLECLYAQCMIIYLQ